MEMDWFHEIKELAVGNIVKKAGGVEMGLFNYVIPGR